MNDNERISCQSNETITPGSEMIAKLAAYVLQLEQENAGLKQRLEVYESKKQNAKHRQTVGIAAAKNAGIHMGRARKEVDPEHLRRYDENLLDYPGMLRLCDTLNIGVRTFYARLNEYRENKRDTKTE